MSEESAADSSVDLKKRARRRLVGAAALALLAVIVLPIVMDSEPKPSGQEIQIRIPSQDNGSLASRLIPGSPPPPMPTTQVTNKAAPVADTPALKLAEVADKAAVSSTAAAVIPEKIRAEVPVTKTDAVKNIEVKHAEAVLDGKDSDQWLVQLGAYQNAANVKQLTGKLKEMDLPSSTEKVDLPQGTRIRVRAGPFKSHDAAEKARMRIKKIGVDGQVVQK